MHNQPFDLSQLDYKTVRLVKRKKLLIYSAVPVALVLIATLWFILPQVLTSKAMGDYKLGNYKGARRWLTPLTWTSPERFVVAFNSGTVDSKLGNYDRSEAELTRAFALAPSDKRCMVVNNLVYTLEVHANDLTTKGKPEDASIATKRATNYKVDNQPCFEWELSAITKADKTQIKIGEAVTFTYQVSNSGPGTAVGVSWNGNWFMSKDDLTGKAVPDNGTPPDVTVNPEVVHTDTAINSDAPVGESDTYNPLSAGYICGYTAYSPNKRDGQKHPRSAIVCVKVIKEGGGGGGGGGGSSSSSAQTNTLSASQQQQLEQKEQEGRERQAKYASQENYDPNNPELKPW